MARPTPKILFVSPQPFFIERGSPYRVRAEVQALLDNGYEVDLLCYPIGREISIPGLRIIRSKNPWGIKSVPIGWSRSKLLLDFSLFTAMCKQLRKTKYVAVHGVEDAGVMAAFISLFSKRPFVFDMHSQMTEQLSQCVIKPGSALFRFLCGAERWCMSRSSGVITVSDVITERVRSLAPGVPAITLEDLALDSSTQVSLELRDSLRQEYNTAAHRVLLYTGNFEPYQGVELLLNAFSQLLKLEALEPRLSKPPLLLIVGGGAENSTRFVETRALAESLGLGSAVKFAGQRNEDEVGSFMDLADVFVSPRIAGAHTPLKIYSYMAGNKPIVATRIAAHTNALSSKEAYLGEPSAEALAESLRFALDDSELASHRHAQLVSNAGALLKQRFSKAEFGRRMKVLYSAVLGQEVSEELILPRELVGEQEVVEEAVEVLGSQV